MCRINSDVMTSEVGNTSLNVPPKSEYIDLMAELFSAAKCECRLAETVMTPEKLNNSGLPADTKPLTRKKPSKVFADLTSSPDAIEEMFARRITDPTSTLLLRDDSFTLVTAEDYVSLPRMQFRGVVKLRDCATGVVPT